MNIVTGRLLITLISISVLISCAPSRKTTVPSTRPEKPTTVEYDESFDPLTLNDDDIQFPEKKTVPVTEPTVSVTSPGAKEEEQPVNKLIDGFRVQLLATKDIESATVAKKEAEFVFAEDGVNVYVEFDTPYYKVRIGDCKTREEAEKLREIARRKGYPSAWIVKTRVWSHPPMPVRFNPYDSENNPQDG